MTDAMMENSELTMNANPQETLEKMLELLGVQAEVTLQEGENASKLCIASEEAGRLIGRKGQTLEALELVLNRILKKNEDANNHIPWMSIDVDGYSVEVPKHEGEHNGRLPRMEMERLEAMAKDFAKEVKRMREPRIVGPYSPAERRIIHLTLEKDPEVETVSDPVADKNRGKKITIRLKEAPVTEN